MIEKIWDEIRYVRERLDGHIHDEDDKLTRIHNKLNKVSEDMAGHKVQVALLATVISLVIGGIIAAYFNGG